MIRKLTRKVGESLVLDGSKRLRLIRIDGSRAWFEITDLDTDANNDRRPRSRAPLLSGSALWGDG